MVLTLGHKCSGTLHLNLRAMRRGGVARRKGAVAGVTPRIKKHGTSAFKVAIKDTQVKITASGFFEYFNV